MKYEKNRKIAGIDELTFIKMMKILALPIIAVILIIVILVADRVTKGSDNTVQSSESASPDNGKYVNDFTGYGLSKDTVPEINALIGQYQTAMIDGDAEAMYKVYGLTDTVGMDELRTKLTEEKKVYEAYEDTVCYTTPGIEEGSYVVFVSCKLKFQGIDTPAPMLSRAYAVKGAGNTYALKEESTWTEEEKNLIEQVNTMEDVQLLIKQTNQDLATAVVNDPKLGALYNIFMDTGDSSETVAETESETETSEEESVSEASISILQDENGTVPGTETAPQVSVPASQVSEPTSQVSVPASQAQESASLVQEPAVSDNTQPAEPANVPASQ